VTAIYFVSHKKLAVDPWKRNMHADALRGIPCRFFLVEGISAMLFLQLLMPEPRNESTRTAGDAEVSSAKILQEAGHQGLS